VRRRAGHGGPASHRPWVVSDHFGEGARRYVASYEIVAGQMFEPDPREPIARIAAALDAA